MDLGVTLSPGLIVKNSPTGLIQPPNNFILEESLSKLGDGASDSPKQAAYIFLER
ncbi:MAG: Uncharacterised protein [Opitutia bacterium UBA7350]|nr:MAG: Uncharacterised protein [Opitutae bacterium UBA7350]